MYVKYLFCELKIIGEKFHLFRFRKSTLLTNWDWLLHYKDHNTIWTIVPSQSDEVLCSLLCNKSNHKNRDE